MYYLFSVNQPCTHTNYYHYSSLIHPLIRRFPHLSFEYDSAPLLLLYYRASVAPQWQLIIRQRAKCLQKRELFLPFFHCTDFALAPRQQ